LVLASRLLLLRGEDFGFNAWSVTEYQRGTDCSCWAPLRGFVLPNNSAVGSLTALAFVLIIGREERFRCGKQIGSSLGAVRLEELSADRRRLGHISK